MPVEVVKAESGSHGCGENSTCCTGTSRKTRASAVESKRYPRLQQMGSDGDYYTQEQIRMWWNMRATEAFA